jgi:hypothetical protein
MRLGDPFNTRWKLTVKTSFKVQEAVSLLSKHFQNINFSVDHVLVLQNLLDANQFSIRIVSSLIQLVNSYKRTYLEYFTKGSLANDREELIPR